MKESFKQKMQENKPPLTFKNTKKNICLEKKTGIFFDADQQKDNEKEKFKTKTIKKTKTQVLTQIKHKCICGKYYIDQNMK